MFAGDYPPAKRDDAASGPDRRICETGGRRWTDGKNAAEARQGDRHVSRLLGIVRQVGYLLYAFAAGKQRGVVRVSVSPAEAAFAEAWERIAPDGHDLTAEFRFHPIRRWRFDFAFPSQKLGVEIEGRGRHQTVAGVRNDCEKYNEAARMGWRLLKFPATDKSRADDWARTVLDVITGD